MQVRRVVSQPICKQILYNVHVLAQFKNDHYAKGVTFPVIQKKHELKKQEGMDRITIF